jgi:hypothetical protein
MPDFYSKIVSITASEGYYVGRWRSEGREVTYLGMEAPAPGKYEFNKPEPKFYFMVTTAERVTADGQTPQDSRRDV